MKLVWSIEKLDLNIEDLSIKEVTTIQLNKNLCTVEYSEVAETRL